MPEEAHEITPHEQAKALRRRIVRLTTIGRLAAALRMGAIDPLETVSTIVASVCSSAKPVTRNLRLA